jgi:hypothetical protein
MMLDEAVNHAAANLPEGWSIMIQVEHGSGWVELYNQEGGKVELNNSDMDLAESVSHAVARATGGQ